MKFNGGKSCQIFLSTMQARLGLPLDRGLILCQTLLIWTCVARTALNFFHRLYVIYCIWLLL